MQSSDDYIPLLTNFVKKNFLLVLDHVDDVVDESKQKFRKEIDLLSSLPNLKILITCSGSIDDLIQIVKGEEIHIKELEDVDKKNFLKNLMF